MRCPRRDCPNPTVHVGKSGSKFHCVGCWREFDADGCYYKIAEQKQPPMEWLRAYSPHIFSPQTPISPSLFRENHMIRSGRYPARRIDSFQPVLLATAPRKLEVDRISRARLATSARDENCVSRNSADVVCRSDAGSPEDKMPLRRNRRRTLILSHAGREYKVCRGSKYVEGS